MIYVFITIILIGIAGGIFYLRKRSTPKSQGILGQRARPVESAPEGPKPAEREEATSSHPAFFDLDLDARVTRLLENTIDLQKSLKTRAIGHPGDYLHEFNQAICQRAFKKSGPDKLIILADAKAILSQFGIPTGSTLMKFKPGGMFYSAGKSVALIKVFDAWSPLPIGAITSQMIFSNNIVARMIREKHPELKVFFGVVGFTKDDTGALAANGVTPEGVHYHKAEFVTEDKNMTAISAGFDLG